MKARGPPGGSAVKQDHVENIQSADSSYPYIIAGMVLIVFKPSI